jgi:hypothetical protein
MLSVIILSVIMLNIVLLNAVDMLSVLVTSIVMISVVLLNVIALSMVMLNVVNAQSSIMLSAVILNVAVLSVVASFRGPASLLHVLNHSGLLIFLVSAHGVILRMLYSWAELLKLYFSAQFLLLNNKLERFAIDKDFKLSLD